MVKSCATPENKNERILVGTVKKLSYHSFCPTKFHRSVAVQGKGEKARVCKNKARKVERLEDAAHDASC